MGVVNKARSMLSSLRIKALVVAEDKERQALKVKEHAHPY